LQDKLGRAANFNTHIYITWDLLGTYSNQYFSKWYGTEYAGDGSMDYFSYWWGASGSNEYFGTRYVPNVWGTRPLRMWASIHTAYNPNISPSPTPTISPTGTPNTNFCASVSSAETGFSWSGISIGQTSCLDIGPYDGFDFGGLTSNPIGAYPWLAHICLQDVSFGVAEVFGVSVSLQVILYILGVVAIVRNMFVS
jgi:hypothetical protein